MSVDIIAYYLADILTRYLPSSSVTDTIFRGLECTEI
jgi:hypothetical protein